MLCPEPPQLLGSHLARLHACADAEKRDQVRSPGVEPPQPQVSADRHQLIGVDLQDEPTHEIAQAVAALAQRGSLLPALERPHQPLNAPLGAARSGDFLLLHFADDRLKAACHVSLRLPFRCALLLDPARSLAQPPLCFTQPPLVVLHDVVDDIVETLCDGPELLALLSLPSAGVVVLPQLFARSALCLLDHQAHDFRYLPLLAALLALLLPLLLRDHLDHLIDALLHLLPQPGVRSRWGG